MSRIAKSPVCLPGGLEVRIADRQVTVKGAKGELSHRLHVLVDVSQENGKLQVSANSKSKQATALAGTTRAVLQNMVTGVSQGFERRLEVIGIGYRAQVQGKNLDLTLGFSHRVQFPIPDGVTVETPSQTEIVIQGADKQQVGQVAADIRAYRPPEPYKGKGVRYSDERIIRKEAKKA